MEARMRYKFDHVPVEKRDEKHEEAIREAQRKVRAYEGLLGELAAALSKLPLEKAQDAEKRGEVRAKPSPQGRETAMKKRSAKPMGKPLSVGVSKDDLALISEFDAETEMEVQALCKSLHDRVTLAMESIEASKVIDLSDMDVESLTSHLLMRYTCPTMPDGTVRGWRRRAFKCAEQFSKVKDLGLRNIIILEVKSLRDRYPTATSTILSAPTQRLVADRELHKSWQPATTTKAVSHLTIEELIEARRYHSDEAIIEAVTISMIGSQIDTTGGRMTAISLQELLTLPMAMDQLGKGSVFTLTDLLVPPREVPFYKSPAFDLSKASKPQELPALKALLRRTDKASLLSVEDPYEMLQLAKEVALHMEPDMMDIAALWYWRQTKHVPWQLVVSRPSQFLLQLRGIRDQLDEEETVLRIPLEQEALLRNIIDRCRHFLWKQLGDTGDKVYLAGLEQRGAKAMKGEEARLPNLLLRISSTTTPQDVREYLSRGQPDLHDHITSHFPEPVCQTVITAINASCSWQGKNATIAFVGGEGTVIETAPLNNDRVQVLSSFWRFFSFTKTKMIMYGPFLIVSTFSGTSINRVASTELGLPVTLERMAILYTENGRIQDLPTDWKGIISHLYRTIGGEVFVTNVKI